MNGKLQFYNDKLLFKSSDKLAMASNCCCSAGDCQYCNDKIHGVLITVSGIAASGSPDCCCSPMNGSWFVPWDADGDTNGCTSKEAFDYNTASCSNYKVYADYAISCTGTTLRIDGGVTVSNSFGTQCGDISSICTTTVPSCPMTCVGKTCTDNSPTSTYCDVSGASITFEIK